MTINEVHRNEHILLQNKHTTRYIVREPTRNFIVSMMLVRFGEFWLTKKRIVRKGY